MLPLQPSRRVNPDEALRSQGVHQQIRGVHLQIRDALLDRLLVGLRGRCVSDASDGAHQDRLDLQVRRRTGDEDRQVRLRVHRAAGRLDDVPAGRAVAEVRSTLGEVPSEA